MKVKIKSCKKAKRSHRPWWNSVILACNHCQVTSHLILFILVDYTRPQQSDTITALRRRYQNQSGTRVIRYRLLNWGLKRHYSNTIGIRHIMWDLNKTIQHAIERSNTGLGFEKKGLGLGLGLGLWLGSVSFLDQS